MLTPLQKATYQEQGWLVLPGFKSAGVTAAVCERARAIVEAFDPAAGASRFVECGPGKVLAGLIKRIDRGVESKSLGSVADFEDALNGWGGE